MPIRETLHESRTRLERKQAQFALRTAINMAFLGVLAVILAFAVQSDKQLWDDLFVNIGASFICGAFIYWFIDRGIQSRQHHYDLFRKSIEQQTQLDYFMSEITGALDEFESIIKNTKRVLASAQAVRGKAAIERYDIVMQMVDVSTSRLKRVIVVVEESIYTMRKEYEVSLQVGTETAIQFAGENLMHYQNLRESITEKLKFADTVKDLIQEKISEVLNDLD